MRMGDFLLFIWWLETRVPNERPGGGSESSNGTENLFLYIGPVLSSRKALGLAGRSLHRWC